MKSIDNSVFTTWMAAHRNGDKSAIDIGEMDAGYQIYDYS